MIRILFLVTVVMFSMGVFSTCGAVDNRKPAVETAQTEQRVDLVEGVGNVLIADKEYHLFLLEGRPANKIIALFNDRIRKKKKTGTIEQCRRVIEMPVGTAQGNHSYGGICLLKDGGFTKAVMICTDEMMGRLKIVDSTGPAFPIIYSLSVFVSENCYGG